MSDWLYTEERLKLRANCISALMHSFGWMLDASGLPKYSMQTMHDCAHDWVSQGNPSADGITNYYLSNYAG